MTFLERINCTPPNTPYFDTYPDEGAGEYDQAAGAVPKGWMRSETGPWVLLQHDEGVLPAQGWKVHVSATLGSSAETLNIAFKYLTTQTTWSFKFIRNREALFHRGFKYGDRSASGKFITIYPPTVSDLARCLKELGERLEGRPGPYLLSDLRWNRGPLYVRYGGFVERMRYGAAGQVEHLIETPGGAFVPDRRGVGFYVPDWVDLPEVLSTALEARNQGTLRDFPYTVRKALHFSNAGGIYLAEHDETGQQVVLREARPHAGEDADGNDAVARLLREEAVLKRLQGCPGVPQLIERRTGYEHTYLIRDYVEGHTLADLIAENPLTVGRVVAGEDARERYRTRMLDLMSQIDSILHKMHCSGVVFGDLQPGNIIVGDDGLAVFIDFEGASFVEEHRGQPVATPGFAAPFGTVGTAVDRFALGILKFAVFWPVPTLFGWHPALFNRQVEFAVRCYDLPEDYVACALADIEVAAPRQHFTPHFEKSVEIGASSWPRMISNDARAALCDDLVAGIVESATLDRSDRLFPGDAPTVHDPDGGLNLRTGAAGVLWALQRWGAPVPADHVEWLVREAESGRMRRPGFFDGAAGVAFTLELLGQRAVAERIVHSLLGVDEKLVDVSYGTGLSGIGWTFARLGNLWDDRTLRKAAMRIGERLAEHPLDVQAAGLFKGATGAVLLWEELRRAGHVSDDAWHVAAVEAFKCDLALLNSLNRPQVTGDSSLAETSRTTLFTSLSYGGGTALVAKQFCSETHCSISGDLQDFVDAVTIRSEGAQCVEVGLFQGEVGRLAVRRALGVPVSPADLGGLGMFSISLCGRHAFFGGDNLRISSDMSTGAAGVLAALSSFEGGELVPGVVVPGS